MANITDQINQASPLDAAMMAFWVASNIQDEKPGLQVVSMGMLFKVLADEMGVDIPDLLAKISSMLMDTDPYHHRQVAALRQLIREEYLTK